MFVDKSKVVGCLEDGFSVVVSSEYDPFKVLVIEVCEAEYAKIKAALDNENELAKQIKGGEILEEIT